jgi:hypothetical protein
MSFTLAVSDAAGAALRPAGIALQLPLCLPSPVLCPGLTIFDSGGTVISSSGGLSSVASLECRTD